jgi:hypothetical protein
MSTSITAASSSSSSSSRSDGGNGNNGSATNAIGIAIGMNNTNVIREVNALHGDRLRILLKSNEQLKRKIEEMKAEGRDNNRFVVTPHTFSYSPFPPATYYHCHYHTVT